ncbi:tyrosinase-like protein tyr-1 [Biomphalaria glabrata]|nr:tyrosinase-like protein tyr-1 [Biomphalaria glabrata]
MYVLLLTLTLAVLHVSNARISEIPAPEPLQECYQRVETENVDSYIGSLYNWHCEHMMSGNLSSENTETSDPQAAEYIKQLYEKSLTIEAAPARRKRQSTLPRCVRKEYRMLTLEERTRYHNAINTLKRDTTVRPNKYDVIAAYHTGVNNARAHGGPGFLGWHRIYLMIYETALREVDPTVCVPYWDSTLESQLTNPSLSSIWTPEFLGTTQGAVVAGPFANWLLPNRSPLIRNVGIDGEPVTTADVTNILSRSRYEEIVTSPTVPARYDIELQHGSVHVYISGAMNRLDTAAFDPVFFMHHSFIDYIFERFRAKMTGDPAAYPTVPTNTRHASTATTGLPGGSRQIDGYAASLANRVTYEPVPTCSAAAPSCGDRFLVCQTSTGRCLPTTRTTRARRNVDNPNTLDTCENPTFGQAIQNDYCCSKTCDTNQWAMIPVRVVSVRPPKFQNYSSYPVTSGQLNRERDIYFPNSNSRIHKYIGGRLANPKTFKRCTKDSPAGQVFVYSNGINYSGYYKEYVIADHRQAVSVSIGFVGMKKPSPGDGVTKALLRAHDSCGRVCRVLCKDPASKQFKACSGAVALSDQKPHMYGASYDDAVMDLFDYASDGDCPRYNTDDFYITFFCDYHNKFPYSHQRSYN